MGKEGDPKEQCIHKPLGRACGGSQTHRRRSHEGFPLPKGMLGSQRKLIRTAALLWRAAGQHIYFTQFTVWG